MKTDLKQYMMQLQGGQYLKIPGRIVAFREEHPQGSIITELVQIDLDRGIAMFKATVKADDVVLATAYGSETFKGFPQGWIEKAETVAVGRALAQAGFGTAYAMADFHESSENKLSDSTIPSRQATQQVSERDEKIKLMFARAKEAGVSPGSLKAMLAERGYATSSADLELEHVEEMIKVLSADF